MAIFLINDIANVPASPEEGDILRFSVAITNGIPTTVKKANGTTTETLIQSGDEFRFIQDLWMKIGGDAPSITPLKDAPILAESEFADAILGAVHNNTNSGRLRKAGIGLLAQALIAENLINAEIRSETIFENSAIGGDLTKSLTTPFNLDIIPGTSTRHNFNDGYFGFTFQGREITFNLTDPDKYFIVNQVFISKEIWFETQEDETKTISTGFSAQSGTADFFWKASDSSFYGYNSTDDIHLKRIIGHKII